ncbi:MAG: penicillin acylase family protein [Gemmatimonadaceae bacterium]
MRFVKILGALLILGATVFIGWRGAGPVPPLGLFLDPVRGAWSALATLEHPDTLDARIPGLRTKVDIRYDMRGVPHIFASSEDDLFRALGYVVARDRMFQMDLQVRAGAGTLTELVGDIAIPADSEPRHLGMPRAAERAWARFPDSAPGKRFARAYAAGVNAWIDGASAAEIPVEYKLLGAQPARWQPINSLHLYNRMGWTLTYAPGERARAAAEALVGRAAAHAILPVNSPIQEPIQPNGSESARYDFTTIPAPGTPDTIAAALLPLLPRSNEMDADRAIARRFASNNWAVAPSRSRSGHALLAGDPHLELTLPSIWYEVHLVIPGRLDVYGVTIPGSPGVVIGFNRDLAWSFTNTGGDVLDYYRETVNDNHRPTKYLLDNAWKDLEPREEVYRGKTGQVIRVDTLRFTHRGPLMRLGADWVSMRWTVLEPSDLVAGFHGGARARTAVAFLDALAGSFFAPAQNMIVADRQGSIAIRSTGHFPIRPNGADGLTMHDGSRSASDWQGYWPLASYPQSVNPAQGFLASANQQPIDPTQDSRYFGYDEGYEAWRALQINTLLRAHPAVTIEDMRDWQTHPGSVRADLFVVHFLAATAKLRTAGSISSSLASADSLLRHWDRLYTLEGTGTALFEAAMRELSRRTWDELIPSGERSPVATPSGHVLLALLADSVNAWWNDRRTSDRMETRDDILVASLTAAFDTLVQRNGAPTREAWAWGKLGTANVDHLLQLSGFSRRGLATTGGAGTLNPSPGSGFGSSWRMVVELGDRVTALGTYPGGQSGNPASPRYDDRLQFWRRGDLELLYVPATLEAVAPAQVRAALTLLPSGGGR